VLRLPSGPACHVPCWWSRVRVVGCCVNRCGRAA